MSTYFEATDSTDPSDKNSQVYPERKQAWKNRRFQKFQRDNFLCDITLKSNISNAHPHSSQLRGIKAHKLILAEASPFFFEKFAATRSKEINVGEIDLLTLEQLVNYIYTGKLILSEDNIINIFKGSKEIDLSEVARKCEEFLMDDLNNDNVWQRYKLSRQMDSHERYKIIHYVHNNWDTVTSKPAFLELSFEEFKILLRVIQPSPELSLSMFNSIQAWVCYNEDRKVSVAKLLQLIELKAVPMPDLLEYFDQAGFRDLEFTEFKCSVLTDICKQKSQRITCSQESPGTSLSGFTAQINQGLLTDDEDDDVILLPTPPRQLKSLTANASTIPLTTAAEKKQLVYTPNKRRTKRNVKTETPCVQSSSSNFSQNKIPERKSITPSNKKPRLDESDSFEDFANTTSLNPDQSIGSYVDYFLRKSETQNDVSQENDQGRLFCMNNQSLTTFDIRLVPNWKLVEYPDIITLAESSRKKSCLIYYSNKIYHVGGLVSNHTPLDRVDSFDLTANNPWETEDKLIQARYSHTIVESNGFLYVIGGSSGKESLSSMERFNPAATKPSWANVKPMSQQRESHGAVVHNGKIYAVGGFQQASDGTGGICLDTMECYDPEEDTWSPKPSMKQKLYGMAVAVYNDKLYVIGGQTQRALKQKKPSTESVQVFNFKTERWSYRKRLKHGRKFGTAVVIDGTLLAVGGDILGNPKVEVFIPVRNEWHVIPGNLSTTGSYQTIAVKP